MTFKTVKKLVKETDIFLLIITLALSVLGTVMVASATMGENTDSLLSRDAKVMILATCLGLFAGIIISFKKIHFSVIEKTKIKTGIYFSDSGFSTTHETA